MTKIKTITLSAGWSGDQFRVEKITDSIEYLPRAMINKDDVEALCRANGWKVTVVKYEGK